MINRLERHLGGADPSGKPPDLNASRPETLDEFVGQDHLKDLIRTAVDSSRKRNAAFPHTLVTGAAGLGKTSIARLIACQMGVRFVPVTAEALEDISPTILNNLAISCGKRTDCWISIAGTI